MISRIHLFAAALAGVLVCSVAGAQAHHAPESTPLSRFSGHARSTARASANFAGATATGSQANQQASVIQISASGQILAGAGPIANSISFDGVPGLGFDYPHLAAISGALRNNPSSHFGHNQHRGQGSFVPILFGGYPYYDDFGYEQPEQQPAQQSPPQPQIIVIQQPVPAQQGGDTERGAGNLSAALSESPAPAPVSDVGDFILVRRDGRILFASVFSVVGTQLQYVTPEGIRRTLAMADLDAAATQQMNEARGTSLQIHN